MPVGGHVHADLVRPPRLQAYRNRRDDLPVGERRPAERLHVRARRLSAGTTGERLLVKMNGEKTMNMNLISTKDHGQSFLILESGRAAAFVMDEPLLYGERTKAKSAGDWVVVGAPLQTENYACMFRKDDPSFKKLADGVIADLQTSGRAEKLRGSSEASSSSGSTRASATPSLGTTAARK